jgi:hypothetical protein
MGESELGFTQETDDAGRTVFRGLLPSQARVSAAGISERTVDVAALDGRPLRLQSMAAARISGRLRAGGDVCVLARVITARRGASGEVMTASSEGGAFLMAPVPPGHYTLEVRPQTAPTISARPEATAEVDVPDHGVVEINIDLPPADGVLTGTVIDDGGQPVGDALVIYGLAGRASFRAGANALSGGLDAVTTELDGRFHFEGVTRGSV